jgi:hypothetical protein
MSLTALTEQQKQVWDNALEFYLNDEHDDNWADELAWQDFIIEFPQFAEYEGIE